MSFGIGKVLCDMHCLCVSEDRIAEAIKEHCGVSVKVKKIIRSYMSGGSKFITDNVVEALEGLTWCYHNKMLVIVQDWLPGAESGCIAAWSYDNASFGMCEVVFG
mgnify:CR=1 FL=1